MLIIKQYNPKIHNRQSLRLQGYDYSRPGLYFITLNVHGRKHLFGEILIVEAENLQPRLLEQQMILNDAGKFADQCWREIPEHFPNAILHAYVIMPDHIHGIIELKQNGDFDAGAKNFQPRHQKNKFQKMIPRSIGSIVKGFKIGVTKWLRNNYNMEKIWQRNYYERIIRNKQSYHRISKYIIDNPKNWGR